MLRVMDLFSGIGGFSLGLKRAGGFKTVCYCEIEPYCQKVLQARMLDGSLDSAPICADIRKLDGRPWRGRIDVVTGGFPCQDISNAGDREGIDGEQSGLWREMGRIVCEVRPRFVVVENVSALLVRGLERVLGDLAEGGYDAEWDCIPATAVGAPHIRDRIWIVAYPSQGRGPQDEVRAGRNPAWSSGSSLAHAEPSRLSGWFLQCEGPAAIVAPKVGRDRAGAQYGAAWHPEPEVDRVVDGFPSLVDELGALGNAIVPQIAEWIGRRILERVG